jgi:hypothetical protein
MWNFTKVYWQQTFYNASVESAQDAERRQEGGAGQGVRAGRVGKQKEFGQGEFSDSSGVFTKSKHCFKERFETSVNK